MNNERTQLFIGKLGKEPELRYTRNQKPVCTLSVAVKDEEQQKTHWHKVVVWGKQAELANQYLRKGSDIFVQGQRQMREFRTSEGEMKRYEEVFGLKYLKSLGSLMFFQG